MKYNHEAKGVLDACGLTEKDNHLFASTMAHAMVLENSTSKIVKRVEKYCKKDKVFLRCLILGFVDKALREAPKLSIGAMLEELAEDIKRESKV